ncbi:MAG: NUDIX hydrolase [Lachnospiraceae bacterium]|nr:NUDIX hydrolase [Lachnospiraceae bacterium]
MEHVITEKRTLVHKGSIIDVYSDEMLLPNGNHETWDYVEHRMGAACVLPVLPNGKIVMVKQFRHALNRYTIEVPAGSRDSKTEDTLVCATRELEEETGYTSDNIEFLLSLKTTVAFCNESIDVYLARDLKPGKQHLDEAESINVLEFELDELLDMIYQGKLQDSKTVSAILAYAVKCRN